MKYNRIYRLDEENLELKPINPIVRFFLNNPLILCAIIIFCLGCGYMILKSIKTV